MGDERDAALHEAYNTEALRRARDRLHNQLYPMYDAGTCVRLYGGNEAHYERRIERARIANALRRDTVLD
jgi:hypothetical protein